MKIQMPHIGRSFLLWGEGPQGHRIKPHKQPNK